MTQVITERSNGRLRVQTAYDDESLTVQSDRVKAEIRSILQKFNAVGIVDHLREVDLQFRDVSEFEDFADLMRQTKVAEAEFMRLPSKLREVFNHDVNEWLDVAHDAEKLEALRPQLEELGVLEPEAPAPAPTRVEVVHRNADGTFAEAPPPSPSSSGEGDGA